MAYGDQKNESDRIVELERRIRELEEKINELMPWIDKKLWDWPVMPIPPKEPTAEPWPVFEEPRCPVCNNEYKNMTHYVCNHDRCPNMIAYKNEI